MKKAGLEVYTIEGLRKQILAQEIHQRIAYVEAVVAGKSVLEYSPD